ncbi:MAG: RNA polymerase factor sigma-54 [Planctomycetota bacterium]|nr:RNA polymerase factor sigma-54 [Planctomycetota bacterium]
MRLSLSQTPRMEQRLVQSPQMIQAMQILQLSALDLEERVEQELIENPFLEEVEPEREDDGEYPAAPGEDPAASGEDPAASGEGPAAGTDDASDVAAGEAEASEGGSIESMMDELERYERDFGDGPRLRVGSVEEADRKLEAMQNTPATYHSLGDSLMEQIALSDLDEHRRQLAEYLVYSLDHKGYLPETLESIARHCDVPDVTVEELQEVLDDLRLFTHPALGALNLSECLLLQLDAHHIEAPLVRTVIKDHLEDITTNRLPRIARTTGHSIDEIKEAIETLRSLDPIPGREYGDPGVVVIHPDVVVEEVEGDYEVRLTRQRVPELRVSPSYKRMLSQAKKGDGVQEWVKKRLESARWFIDAIHQRQSTLLKIAQNIFERQRGFLDQGVKALKPLRMQEVADAAGVHISTVSRAVSGKHAQTPRGILPLKYFFTGGTAKASGEMTSQASIKLRIQELIEQEDTGKPLSDEELATALHNQDGITIARRTVTKYRKALALPSSGQRKVF